MNLRTRAPRAHRTRRRAALAAFVASAVVAASVPLMEAAPAQATVLPALTPPLTQAAAKLAQASMLPELNQLVPGLATNPAQLFGLHTIFGPLSELTQAADLETAINALDDDPDAGFTLSEVTASDGSTDALSFKLAIDRTVPVELGIIDGDVQLLGGSVGVHVTMPPTPFRFEHNPGVGGGDEFALTAAPGMTSLPELEITMAMDEVLDESLQFGFAQADATGTFHVASKVSLQLTDPDGSGRLTLGELNTADIADVMAVSFSEDTGSDELAATITLTADVAGIDFTGTVSITDAALFEGVEPDVNISLAGTNPIEMLTNLGPDSALAGLNQILSAFGAGMIAGDRPLPFLDGGLFVPSGMGDDFDQVFDAVKPLYDYVQSRSVQLNCGAFPIGTLAPTESDNVPLLPASDLEAGQYVACRAFAGEAPRAGTNVTWNPTGATRLSTVANSFTSVAVEPTTSAIFQMTAPGGDFATTLTFTPDDTGAETTVQQRPQTIQQLIAELTTEAGLSGVTWNPDLEALEFDLSFQSAALARSATVDAGNGLAADTHLTGLSSTGNVGFNVGPIVADLSVGMILTDDAAQITPAPSSPGASTESRRFFVKVPASGNVLSVDNVALSGSAALEARLGFLEVNGTAGLTASKPDAGAPALAVQLTDPPGVKVGSHPNVPDAMLIAELLATPLSYLEVDTNLQVHGDVSLTAEALVASAGAGFEFDWPLGGAPSVDASSLTPQFTSLLDFDAQRDAARRHLVDGGHGDAVAPGKPIEVSVTTNATDLTTKPGLVGALLTRDGQPDCQITAVTTDSMLSCTLTVPEGGVGTTPLAGGLQGRRQHAVPPRRDPQHRRHVRRHAPAGVRRGPAR